MEKTQALAGIDHENGKRVDNRLSNLEACSTAEKILE